VGAPVADDFLDADHGWLVTAADGAAGGTDLYATADGGTTWTRVGAFPYTGLSVDFLTTTLAWAAGDLGQQDGGPAYVVQTGDGGAPGRGWCRSSRAPRRHPEPAAAPYPGLSSPSLGSGPSAWWRNWVWYSWA